MLYGEALDFGNIDNPLSFYYSDHDQFCETLNLVFKLLCAK
mgnify:FL=1